MFSELHSFSIRNSLGSCVGTEVAHDAYDAITKYAARVNVPSSRLREIGYKAVLIETEGE